MNSAVPGVKKAAILLVLLGEDVAANIYKHLSEQELQSVTQEIAELGTVPAESAIAVLEEYHQLTITQEYLARGGSSYAKRLLVKAFGEEAAKALLESVTHAQQMSA